MLEYANLTDEELVRQLLTDDGLSCLEHELLDRLIRALDEVESLDAELKKAWKEQT